MRGILQTQSTLTSNDSVAAIATVDNQGADKSSIAAETAAALIDAALDQPSASTNGSTEMPELYLEISSQHTETLEV